MGVSVRRRNPFAFLVTSSAREQRLASYVLREHGRGRSLREVLDDPYVRNRSTREERARLLERPEVVTGVGEGALAALRTGVGAGES